MSAHNEPEWVLTMPRNTHADRARLVDRLIATLDADPEVDEAWAAELERRQSEIENGTITLLSGPESLAELKAEFK
jgi:putative addiction module component (TIGR02574 family)